MRILYISSGFPWPHNNLDYSIINGFLRLGQDLIAIEARETLKEEFLKYLNDIGPDFILTLHGMNLNINVVQEIKKLRYKIGVWIVDDPYEIDNGLQFARFYDYIFNTEKNVIDIYKQYVKRTYYLPLGTNDEVFKKHEDYRYKSDICIIGTGYKNRLDILDDLSQYFLKYNLKVIGRWWDKARCYNTIKSNINLTIITDEEAAKYYSNAKINLNIHRTYDDETLQLNKRKVKAVSPNNRTFDISAAGGFQITDYREDIDKFYKIGKEIVVYNDVNDLVEKIEYYLHHDDERMEIAENAYKRTLNEHLFTNRLSTMLEVIRKNERL